MLDAANNAVTSAKSDVTVAVVGSPANATAWVKRANRIDLARVDEPGLRMWCYEDGLPFRDEESRARLLAITGGWMKALAHARQLATAKGAAVNSGKLLKDVKTWLTSGDGRKLVAEAGVGPANPVLAETFLSVANLVGPDGENTWSLVELLKLDKDRVDLERLATEAGFDSLDDVVTALSALGCLTDAATGRLRPEPTLAELVLNGAGGSTT
ncbi:hypothetical protein [Actinophytocola sp.]|uniref:hypothetical protein n=1 Tax=Actinophytocola sp. TaxID=1872138 RepID=UPI00389AA6B2